MTFTRDSVNDERIAVDHLGGARSRVPNRRGARLAVAVVIATLALLAAACAHSPKKPAPGGSASSGSSGGPMAQALAYSRCMRSHGISDFPDPSGSGGRGGFGFSMHGGPNSDLNHNNPQYQAANQACQRLLPGGSAEQHKSPQEIAKEAKLATCMRGHGYPTFPDPNSQGAFDFSGIDRNAPAFQSALTTCEAASGFSGPLPVAQGAGR